MLLSRLSTSILILLSTFPQWFNAQNLTIQTTSSNTLTTINPTGFYSTYRSSDSTHFALCHKLNKYGCNPTRIDDLVSFYINSRMDGYTLPTDPCLFDQINMSWIFTQIDSSILNSIGGSYFQIIPCQILTQIPDILTEKNVDYLLDEDYWFGNDGECDVINTANNPYNITTCDYSITDDHNTNNSVITNGNSNSSQEIDKCFNDDKDCYYPFYRSPYKTNKQKDFGRCHCQLSCQLEFYPGNDIAELDNFTQSCCWISLLLIIGYFINCLLEYNKVRKDSHSKLRDLPLTFDIPFICSISLFSMIICLLLPYTILDKDYFSCDHRANTKIVLRSKRLPDANWSCFFQGSVVYISTLVIYTYFALLSFCVWRYIRNPIKPLFGIHKFWWHLAVWTFIISFYIGLVVNMENNSMAANNVLGLCGPNFFVKEESRIFNFYPFVTMMAIYAMTAPLTLYSIYSVTKELNASDSKHIVMTDADKTFKRELINLSVRLCIYTFLLCTSLCCFIYITSELILHGTDWSRVGREWVECLLWESYLFDIGVSDGNYDTNCILDENNILPTGIYFMQGTIVLLVSIASFILSCSNTRYAQWRNMELQIVSQLKSIHSGSTILKGSKSHSGQIKKKNLVNNKSEDPDHSKSNMTMSDGVLRKDTMNIDVDGDVDGTKTENTGNLESINHICLPSSVPRMSKESIDEYPKMSFLTNSTVESSNGNIDLTNRYQVASETGQYSSRIDDSGLDSRDCEIEMQ